MIKLKINNKTSFVSNFLKTINTVDSDTDCVIILKGKSAIAANTSADSTLSVFCEYRFDEDICDSEVQLSIPELSRFIKILECIESDIIELAYEGNTIKYDSDGIRFKYHTGATTTSDKRIEKLEKITKSLACKHLTTFNVPQSTIKGLMKGSAFATDTDKVYFFENDGKIYGELTDKTKPNKDSLTLPVSDSFEGEELGRDFVFSMDNMRVISSANTKDVKIKCNLVREDGKKIGLTIFEMINHNTKVRYIVSPIIK